MTNYWTTRKIAENGIIAAIYFCLTIISYPIAFGQIQFRIAEILVLLCFWRPDFIIGVTLGCFLSNITSSLGPYDMLFGTMATLVSSLAIAFLPRLWMGLLAPVLVNAFVVGFELLWLLELPFWWNVLYVGAGEAAVIVVGYILWLVLIRKKSFKRFLSPSRHADILC